MKVREKPAPRIVRKAEVVFGVLLLPENAQTRFRVRIATFSPTATTFQCQEIWFGHALAVPHQIAVVVLDDRRELIVDVIDDFDVGRAGLVHGGVIAHHGLEKSELHVVAAPRETIHVIDVL